jgi:methionyl-tRNA formyltransferase
MRLVFFGSGEFGLPTLAALARRHDVVLVVTQPDRPAGRHRKPTPTAVAQFAARNGIATLKPVSVNDAETIAAARGCAADAFVVIAYGQRLGRDLLGDTFAINLHGSLLPKYRGAAPIQRAMMAGETATGVSVISLADRMDAGTIFAQGVTGIDPHETAGELHDRLALIGRDLVLEVLERHERGVLSGRVQDETLATRAPKLARADAVIDFTSPAVLVRARVHGLTPWPGCTLRLGDRPIRLLRVEAVDGGAGADAFAPGVVRPDFAIACGQGALRLLSVQPPGGKAMTFEAFRRGHPLEPGVVCAAVTGEC